jgi:hypothetical protein
VGATVICWESSLGWHSVRYWWLLLKQTATAVDYSHRHQCGYSFEILYSVVYLEQLIQVLFFRALYAKSSFEQSLYSSTLVCLLTSVDSLRLLTFIPDIEVQKNERKKRKEKESNRKEKGKEKITNLSSFFLFFYFFLSDKKKG